MPAMMLRASRSSDLGRIRALLKNVFQSGDEAFLEPRQLEWKYWAPRSDYPLDRSYVLENGCEIVAHGAVWPVRLKTSAGTIQALHGIDFAASPVYPGAGLKLARHLMTLAPVGLCIGGTAAAQRMLPRLGKRLDLPMLQCERPLRALKKNLAGKKDLKSPLRLMRDMVWSRLPRAPAQCKLRAEEIAPGAIAPREVRRETMIASERDACASEYIQGCPAARHKFFALWKGDRMLGHFCLSFALSDAKIADLWLDSEDVEDWSAAVLRALEEARRHAEITRILALCSAKALHQALKRSGFRNTLECPVFLYDPEARIRQRDWHLQMLDCDKSFVFEGSE